MDTETARKLAKFFNWAIQHCWEGQDPDGGEMQDKAASLGLIVSEPYDPEEHGESEYGVEPGEAWYRISDAVRAIHDQRS